jgi:hypothetical protein
MSNPQRLFPNLRKRISRFRLRHTYWTFSDSSGKAGFSVVGSPHGRHPFLRLYLKGCDGIQERSHIYKGGSEVAQERIQAHGLVVMSEIHLPDELKSATLKVPNFVELAISLPATPEDYFLKLSASARTDIRKALKHGFSHEVCRDVTWTGEFFNRYYRPSMQSRHGDEAYIMPLSEMEALFRERQTEFVKISIDGICVAAMLCQIDGKNYKFLRLGWLDKDMMHVKRGAVTALYWFLIHRAFQLQSSDVLIGGTPAYLESGVFRFKAKWHGRLYDNKLVYGFRHLLLDPANPVCYRFLANISLLALGSDGSFIVLSSKHPDQVKIPGVSWRI